MGLSLILLSACSTTSERFLLPPEFMLEPCDQPEVAHIETWRDLIIAYNNEKSARIACAYRWEVFNDWLDQVVTTSAK